MLIIRFITWCRSRFLASPRNRRAENKTVLAWHIPDGLLQRERRP